MTKWFEEKKCRIHIDSHFPAELPEFGIFFNAQDTADKLKTAGFEMVQVFSKCMFGHSYYFTKVGVRHPKLRKDVFGEMCEALIARGITVTAYYSLIPDAAQAALHPDWVMYIDKKHDLGFEHVSDCTHMCLQSPYIELIVLPQLKEIFENYPVSGVFFDFARSYFYCGCKWCQQAFKDETGLNLPENDENAPHWQEYIVWKRKEQRRFEQKIDDLRKSISKDFTFVVNYSYTIRNPEAGSELTDFITMDVVEKAEPCGLNVSFNAKYLATCNKSYEIMTTRMINWWSSWGLKPYNTLLYQNAIIQTHGGNSIMGDRWNQDWCSDDVIMKYFADMNMFVSGITKFLGKAVPVTNAAILCCRESLRKSNNTPLNDTENQLTGIQAAHKILTQNHIQCLIINEENLGRYLERLELLIIPEQIIHSEKLLEQLQRFTNKGGLLIGSHTTGTGANMGELFGIKCLDEFSRGFLNLPAEFLHDSKYPFPEIPLDAKIMKFHTKDSTEIARLNPSVYATDSHLGFGPIDRNISLPGVTVKQHGYGHAVYCGAEIFSNYHKTNNPQIKHFINSLVSKYKTDLIMSYDAPDCVELAASESTDAIFLHCFNYSPEKELAFNCSYIDVPVKVSEFHVEIPFMAKIKKVEVFPEDAIKPGVEQKNDRIILTIKGLKVFRSVAIYSEG